MSCNYADGLSPYENKGVLGVSEIFNSKDIVKEKCSTLAKLIKEAKHVVVHTGAGISTSAGIPDFRGPNGVWTLEEKGLKPNINISFTDAQPTKTHMALKQLVDNGMVHYIVSQNIDGLHLKSGIKREVLAELHGNMFVDQCNFCKRQFVRSSPAPTVGQRTSGEQCHGGGTARKPCRGKLHDTILDWEHSLPDDDLDLSDKHSCIADLSICLGTTLQINPSGNVPLNTLRYGGKLVICNLQPTKHDNKADLIINTYVDDVFKEVMELLNLTIPEYKPDDDPVFTSKNKYIEWTVPKKLLAQIKTKFKKNCDGGVKKRVLVKKEYKEQQDELKNQSKALKRLQKSKEKNCRKLKRSRVSDLIDEDVIELNTSDDDDDVILVDNCEDVEMESNTKDKNNIKTDDLKEENKADIKSVAKDEDSKADEKVTKQESNLAEKVTKEEESKVDENIKEESNNEKVSVDSDKLELSEDANVEPDKCLVNITKEEEIIQGESEILTNTNPDSEKDKDECTEKVESKNDSAFKVETQDVIEPDSSKDVINNGEIIGGVVSETNGMNDCSEIQIDNKKLVEDGVPENNIEL